MLPYTPLHHLLLGDFGGTLVMTSGNRSDEPIAYDDEEARERLGGIADAFLGHDRPIHRRCEDSIVRASLPDPPLTRLRAGGGAAPGRAPRARSWPSVPSSRARSASLAVARHSSRRISAIWTPSSPIARSAPTSTSTSRCSASPPETIAHDLHPEYLSTKWALEQDAQLVGVQHHHAHAAACLAEHGETEPALALVFDGTGYGTDGTLWGGELLRCDLACVRAPRAPAAGAAARRRGGDPRALAHGGLLPRAGRAARAVRALAARAREPARERAALLRAWAGSSTPQRRCSALRETVTYEGQAAIELELLAGETAGRAICVGLRRRRGTDRPRARRPGRGTSARRRSPRHSTRRSRPPPQPRARRQASRERSCSPAAASRTCGSLESTRRNLEALGFRVLTHRLVPPNDGGISYGQAAVAAAS